MARNAFEDNARLITEEEVRDYAGKIYGVLPPPGENHHYEIVELASGQFAVIRVSSNR